MKTLLRAALALLLAVPALHRPQAPGEALHSGVRPRDEWLPAAPSQRGAAAEAPAPKRLRPPSAHGPVPLAFVGAAGPGLARDAALRETPRASRDPLPRRINYPPYRATAPPRERR